MNKKVIVISVLVLVAAGVGYFLLRKPKDQVDTKSADVEPEVKTAGTKERGKVTLTPQTAKSVAQVKEDAKTPAQKQCELMLATWKKYDSKFVRSIDNVVKYASRGKLVPWTNIISDSNKAWNESVYIPLTERDMFYDITNLKGTLNKLKADCLQKINW